MFKLKLGSVNDEQIIKTYCETTSIPFAVDVNQGWRDIDYAKNITDLLTEKGALFIEQPFEKKDLKKHELLKTHTITPIIADESLQTLDDLASIQESFDGINIKLMKCGGIHPAIKLMNEAKKRNLSILVGCMSGGLFEHEGSTILANQSNWLDLDGLLLNDLCELD